MANRKRGLLVAFAGVVCVSPDAMFLRWLHALGASGPDVAVAKYIGIIGFMLLLGSYRGLDGARASPEHFLASALCQLGYQLSFTFCLLLTDAAKALLLISLAPLWAALLGKVVLHEPLSARTVVALGLSFGAVSLVFAPWLLDAVNRSGGGDGAAHAGPPAPTPSPDYSDIGDVLALLTGLTQGASLTVNRHAALHRPAADVTLATALSSFCAALIALYLPCYDTSDTHDFWACSPPVWRSPGFLFLALADAVAVALFYVSMLIAPRHIAASEVALVMLLEVILGPLWVWVRFGNVPSAWTLAGGVLLLATLAGYEVVGGDAGDPQRKQAGGLSRHQSALEDKMDGPDEADRAYRALTSGRSSFLW
jgi:drug/metabolite transporter (DMT)-like permease